MAKILIAEDDGNLAKNICTILKSEHHAVEHAADGPAAIALLKAYTYDLIILDWQLPGKTGVEILQSLRTSGCKTPVLMLTGRDHIDDKEKGLDSGADDYLTKPCQPRELAARVRALIRRASPALDNVLQAGSLVLDPQKWSVTKGGQSLNLSKREFKLLEFLMRHPNQTFSAEAIVSRVWESESESTTESLRNHIMRLRSKLDSQGKPSAIRNVPGVGYAFIPDGHCSKDSRDES